MTRPPDHPTDVLLAQSQWLRRLARSLLDEAAAEDVVQETLAAALASPPTAGRPLGPWLANVLRNFARMNLRGDRRRRVREQSVAEIPSEPLPTPEELLSHHQAQRMVAEAVEGLDEPFRSTILLCYGEGLAPSEIARRLDILPGTVRWRLKRALEMTRERLDQSRQGSRRSWALLLAPLAHLPAERRGVPLLLAKGVVVMKAKVAIVAAVVLVLVGLLSLLGRTGRDSKGVDLVLPAE